MNDITVEQKVSFEINSLQPGQTYLYSLFSQNYLNTTTGGPSFFTTPSEHYLFSGEDSIKMKLAINDFNKRAVITDKLKDDFERERTIFSKSLNKLNKNNITLFSDTIFSRKQHVRYLQIKVFLDNITLDSSKINGLELKSINSLTEDLIYVLKKLQKSRKVKKDSSFIQNYEYLMENFRRIIKLFPNQTFGINTSKKDYEYGMLNDSAATTRNGICQENLLLP